MAQLLKKGSGLVGKVDVLLLQSFTFIILPMRAIQWEEIMAYKKDLQATMESVPVRRDFNLSISP